MNNLEIIKIDPLELPSDIAWHVAARHHIKLKEFYVYISEKEGKMYVRNTVPENDIAEFVKMATCQNRYYLDDDSEMGLLANGIYEKYGFAAFNDLRDYHSKQMREQDKRKAAERVQNALPAIQKMVDMRMFDEDMIYIAGSAGRNRKGKTLNNMCGYDDVFVYCLGYLAGLGELKEDYAPEDIANIVDVWRGISEMLEHIDIEEMPRIYGYLKEMYFAETELNEEKGC